MLTEDNTRRGMTQDQALRAARLELGGLSQLRESHREARGLPLLDAFLRDIRYALRTLRRSPGLAVSCKLRGATATNSSPILITLITATTIGPSPGLLQSVSARAFPGWR